MKKSSLLLIALIIFLFVPATHARPRFNVVVDLALPLYTAPRQCAPVCYSPVVQYPAYYAAPRYIPEPVYTVPPPVIVESPFPTSTYYPPSRTPIIAAQARLVYKGFYDGPLDGVIGVKTRNAIIQYQIANNLPASGQMDQTFLKHLHSN